jgi:hypothetical protein
MSLGSWDPEASAEAESIAIDRPTLERLAQFSRAEQLDELEDQLDSDERQRLSGLMSIDRNQWLLAAQELSDEEVLHLIRFFAVAENLPGWEAGERSPVIPLAKTLRKRGQRLEKELLLWLRKVNENRFLPYGPL